MKSVHLSVLASAVGLALAGGGIAAATKNPNGSPDASLLAGGSSAASVLTEAREGGSTESSGRYFITFVEPGLARYRGGITGLAATAAHVDGVSANSSNKLQANSSAALAYRSYLAQQRASHIAEIESALGSALNIRFSFDVTRNAVSVALTRQQAAQIAQLAQNPNSGIASVTPVEIKQTDTFRGPKFIGADKIWDGTAVPAYDTATRGAGVKVGVIDTGTYIGHPSFANDPACGFSAAAPKLHPRDCTSTDSSGVCNGPDANAQAAGDTLNNSHGVHTSSTAAGNTIDNTADAVLPGPLLPDGVTMSGVAPCASVYAYRVADHVDGKLYNDYLEAALENAIIDQVDVANYSIGPTCGGGNPWSELEFLDMMASDIFVAASAGNTRSTCTNPTGLVANNGPWEMTVAASTQDEVLAQSLEVLTPQPVPSNLQEIPLIPGGTTVPAFTQALSNYPLRDYPANLSGCNDTGGIPAHYFDNTIAVIRRGFQAPGTQACGFVEKINNATAAGAKMVVIANNQNQTVSMATTGTTIPAFIIPTLAESDALLAFLTAHQDETPPVDTDLIFKDGFDGPAPTGGVLGNYERGSISPIQGDVLGGFSFRGPTQGQYANLTKPDITGPGVNIYAAFDAADGNYGLDSGTSMSSPHIAGSAALIRAVHPSWSPMEVKSALQTTATLTGYQENGTTQWTVDQVGSGRVDLTKAALAGLTLDETVERFTAANPSGGTLDMRQLNLASLRDVNCNTSCSWTRTFRNRLNVSGTWTISAVDPPGYHLTFSPATFTVTPGHTQAITVTATATGSVPTTMQFGRVDLTEGASHSPVQHLTVALKGNPPTIQLTPTSLAATLLRNTTTTQTISVANTGGAPLNWSVVSSGNGVVWNQPASVNSGWPSDYSTADTAGAYAAADFVVSSAGPVTKITANGFDNVSPVVAPTSITWRIYGDAGGKPNGNPEDGSGAAPVWTYTAGPTSAGVSMTNGRDIIINLAAAGQTVNLTPGTYWFSVAPTYPNPFPSSGTSTAGPWYWFGATQQGALGMLTGDEYGASDWTATTTYSAATTVKDFAFKIEGTIACGAPWLSLSPTSGTNTTGTNTPVTATFDATGMSAGVYNATACFGSNDPVTPVATAAVKMTVTIPTYKVTPSAGAHGAISPSTQQTVNEGSTPVFNLTPDTGWHTDTVTGTCGGTLTGNSFTTAPVMADCSVIASFAQDFVGPQCATTSAVEVMSRTDTNATGYASVKAAFDAINAGTHQGELYVGICADTAEAAPAVLNASGTAPTSYTSISVKPVGGAMRTVSGAIAAGSPLIDLNGADNVTIDGLNTGGNGLTFSNTTASTTSGTSTIRFIGGATGNTVTRTTILGSANMGLTTNGGTVFFSTGTNSGNVLSNNDIGPAGTSLPSKAVYGNGSTSAGAANSGIVVDNNNIHDFFNPTASVSGIYVNAGNDQWTISNNRIYQTAARTFTATGRYAGITLASGGASSHAVTGNRIGFGAADGSGTTFIAGSTNTVRGVDVTSVSTTVATTIDNNVVSGINQTSASNGTSTSAPFIALMLGSTDGLINASGNTIGSLDGSSTIVANLTATTGGTSNGIYNFSLKSTTLNNNKMGAITIQGTGTTAGFNAIYVNTDAAASATMIGNIIGGPGAAGAITSTHTGATPGMFGLRINLATATVTGNTVRNLVGNSSNGGFIVGSGIYVTSATAASPSTISGNTISSFVNNSAAANTSIYAMRVALPALANVVQGNFIDGIVNNSTNQGAQIAGIVASAGNAVVANNMVRLGYDLAGAPITSGITQYGIFEIAGAWSFYYNSVLIGGNSAASTANTFAFVSNQAAGVARDYRNNIFWNAASTASGTGANVALLSTAGAGLASNYNDLYATGTTGFVGHDGTNAQATLANWQTATGQDANSISVDPLFVGATAPTANLHLQGSSPAKGAGTPISGITTDFDGDARSATAPSIGADE